MPMTKSLRIPLNNNGLGVLRAAMAGMKPVCATQNPEPDK